MKKCLFCEKDLSESKIFEGKYWNVLLNKEQHYLGRSFIVLKRHEEDFLKLSLEERQELWELIKITVSALKKLFSPDMFNYAVLGKQGELNTLHIHFHIYPRYKEKRIIHDETFRDERFGQNPYPYEKRFIEEELMRKMVNDMRKLFK